MHSREVTMKTLRKNTSTQRHSSDNFQYAIKRRMTEVIIPQGQNSNHILMPLVASLSKQQEQSITHNTSERWVTWITNRKPSKQQLDSFGSNNTNIRIIHTNLEQDNRWIIWEALNKGNSHTVIADIDSVSKNDIEQLEIAATEGDCVGILTRSINTLH